MRLLWIEDNADGLSALAQGLAKNEHFSEVVEAKDLRTGLEWLGQKGFDAVVVATNLPDASGLAAIDKILDQTRCQVPVILLTGSEDRVLGSEAVRRGAQDFFAKGGLDADTLAHGVVCAVERQKIHRQLLASEQRLKTLFECAPDGYYLHDLRGVIVDANQAAARVVGYERHEFLGRSFLDLNLLDEEGVVQAKLALGRSAQGLSYGPQDYKLRRKDGSLITAEVHTYPVEIEHQMLVLGMLRDVSLCKSALTALEESEERFRSVWEHSIDGMRLTDARGRVMAVNEAYCRLVRLPREKLIGELFSVVYKEAGADGRSEIYQSIIKDGMIIPHLTPRVKLWNSEELDLDVSNSFVQGRNGKLVLSIFRDVTQRKQMELQSAAFSQLGQRLSATENAKEAGEIIFEVADQLLGWDACVFDLYSPEENRLMHVLGKDIIAGQRAEVKRDNQTPSAMARRALEHGAFLLLKESPIVMAKGATPFGDEARPSASLLFAPVRKGAKVIGLLSVQSYTPNAYDEQSLATLEALADHCAGALDRIATQQQLSNILAECPAVIYSLRVEGEQLVLAWVSSYMRQLLGFSPEEIQYRDWFVTHLHPEDRDAVMESRPLIFTQKHTIREYRIRHKNGQYRWIRDERRLVCSEQGVAENVVGSWVDISEWKTMEQQMRQVQKMEAIGQLAGGVAHDFNNLLVVMRGNAELLMLDPSGQSAEAQECLKQITAAAERAANLTRQLLAFSRKQVLQSKPLALNDLIGNLTKMLNRIIGENINLQCHYGAGLPSVQADPGMLEQVLMNLVVNARDAMPKGGELHIATEKVAIDSEHVHINTESRSGDFVCLTVGDNGTGIAPEHLPRIFDPFFTTKEPGKGTGLGLSTVYGIVKQHQGWVEVTSQPGAGATFKIYLPAMAAAVDNDQAQPGEQPPPRGTETILLVEDDPPVRQTTRRVLEAFGYKVLEASSAREGMHLWEQQAKTFALLLTDIVMPDGLNGRQLAEQLSMRQPALKVILMSGYSPDEAGRETSFFKQHQNFRFLQKPCSSRMLLETVRECLDQN